MPFQQVVNRQSTTGFPGQVVAFGPHRAKAARIASDNLTTGTNRMSRAFGWTADLSQVGSGSSITQPIDDNLVSVGGPVFFGILGHPQHYALSGTTPSGLSGGTLAATIDLPLGSEGEFFDMVTGIVVEVFNFTTSAQTINYGDLVYYVPNNISGANNTLGAPYGGLVVVPKGGTAPTGLVQIPNAFVVNATSIAASAVGALLSTYTTIQLTQ